jgi:CubicO group peptidase (beta-lactamase class C family)
MGLTFWQDARVKRRKFLLDASRGALGFGAFWVQACSSRTPNIENDAFLQSLVTAWETGIPQWLHETKMPAVSIAIVRGGRLAWRGAFGVKDTDSGEAVDVNSVFAACSDTKPVFAYGVVKLGERGSRSRCAVDEVHRATRDVRPPRGTHHRAQVTTACAARPPSGGLA